MISHPNAAEPVIQLGHGGGGKLSQQLIQELLVPAFGPKDGLLHDAALLPPIEGQLAFTTDSYVVHPLIFPGGDIGRLAVIGSVNDLAMAGATPVALSLGLILEEGLAMAVLETVVASIQTAAAECGVAVVTGDTKVVERGKGDGLFINTSAVGQVTPGLTIHPRALREGDAVPGWRYERMGPCKPCWQLACSSTASGISPGGDWPVRSMKLPAAPATGSSWRMGQSRWPHQYRGPATCSVLTRLPWLTKGEWW